MKLLYIANQRIPTEKAYGRQVAKMCEVFASLGLEVELVAPKRGVLAGQDLFDYYSIGRNFKFTLIDSPNWRWPGLFDKLAFGIKNLISARRLVKYALRGDYDLIYSRDELPLYFLRSSGKPLTYEAHKFPKSYQFFYKKFRQARVKIVAVTQGLKKEFVSIGFTAEEILVAPDGVDESRLTDQSLGSRQAREKLGLAQYKKLAVYTGSFYRWKGIYVLAEAAQILGADILVVAVGGNDRERQALQKLLDKNRIHNFLMPGYFKNERVLDLYLAAADTLIIPNTSGEKLSELYTSPLKLFSYMAARRPIVASDLPSIREVLNENNAILVRPDSPQALADGIKRALDNPGLAQTLAKQAYADAHQYTWQKRARKILDFI